MDWNKNKRLLHEACRLHGCPFEVGTSPTQMVASLMMRKQRKCSSLPDADAAVRVVKKGPLVQSTFMQDELEDIKSYIGNTTNDRITTELKRRWDVRLQTCLEEFQPDSYMKLE
eukprot:7376956-Prymnesium_polylepis.3